MLESVAHEGFGDDVNLDIGKDEVRMSIKQSYLMMQKSYLESEQ